jgi:predicted secreted protein
MRWYSYLAIYLLVWVLCAFVILPFGIRSPEEHEKIPGQADSAPANFRPATVILRTTILAAVICGLVFLNYKEGWIGMKNLDVFGEPAGFSTGLG